VGFERCEPHDSPCGKRPRADRRDAWVTTAKCILRNIPSGHGPSVVNCSIVSLPSHGVYDSGRARTNPMRTSIARSIVRHLKSDRTGHCWCAMLEARWGRREGDSRAAPALRSSHMQNATNIRSIHWTLADLHIAHHPHILHLLSRIFPHGYKRRKSVDSELRWLNCRVCWVLAVHGHDDRALTCVPAYSDTGLATSPPCRYLAK
jgi:hypothetical protein